MTADDIKNDQIDAALIWTRILREEYEQTPWWRFIKRGAAYRLWMSELRILERLTQGNNTNHSTEVT